eukprot:scaffold69568_cov19-Tisochrysis_lutea.AAC.3
MVVNQAGTQAVGLSIHPLCAFTPPKPEDALQSCACSLKTHCICVRSHDSACSPWMHCNASSPTRWASAQSLQALWTGYLMTRAARGSLGESVLEVLFVCQFLSASVQCQRLPVSATKLRRQAARQQWHQGEAGVNMRERGQHHMGIWRRR